MINNLSDSSIVLYFSKVGLLYSDEIGSDNLHNSYVLKIENKN